MITQDMHVHTCFCDGENTVEETVCAAIERGMTLIGFSGHGYTPFDTRYCMSKEGTREYIREVRVAAETYKDKIRILCGIEQDFYSDPVPAGVFDFIIGSVHYLKIGDEYVPVDEDPELLKDAADRLFGGDIYALAAEYFRHVSQVVDVTDADVIGHFDLITKFNEGGVLFDETDPRYTVPRDGAVKTLLKTGKPFEVNTGAMSRGYRTSPYPAEPVLALIKEGGGKVLLSGDVHSAENLCFGFAAAEQKLRAMGLTVILPSDLK